MSTEDQIAHCSFCEKHKDSVGKLIVGHNVAICNECVDFCQDLLQRNQKKVQRPVDPVYYDPRSIHHYLDQHVIGQDQAKMVLSVAIANHYKRINHQDKDQHFQKANILVVGPTGTGKTLMAQTVAQYLDVPFVIADATTLTEAGYVGEDADSLISRLYLAAGQDTERTQRGIVFLDEVDKIARKSEGSSVSRDVSGEGVQQALLKLIEGTRCRISNQGGKKIPSSDTVEIDTTNILFIVGGAFIGLEDIVKKRRQGSSIGFGASVGSLPQEDSDPTPDDLVKFGMIPEFVGRFPSVVSLHPLTKEHLVSILTGVENNLIAQYRWLFEQDGVALDFDQDSLDFIAERTLASRTGARGLRSEMERILLPHMYNLRNYRERDIVRVLIDRHQVNTPTQLAQENQ